MYQSAYFSYPHSSKLHPISTVTLEAPKLLTADIKAKKQKKAASTKDKEDEKGSNRYQSFDLLINPLLNQIFLLCHHQENFKIDFSSQKRKIQNLKNTFISSFFCIFASAFDRKMAFFDSEDQSLKRIELNPLEKIWLDWINRVISGLKRFILRLDNFEKDLKSDESNTTSPIRICSRLEILRQQLIAFMAKEEMNLAEMAFLNHHFVLAQQLFSECLFLIRESNLQELENDFIEQFSFLETILFLNLKNERLLIDQEPCFI